MVNEELNGEKGTLEKLEKHVQELLSAPQPLEFVRYLQNMVERVRNQRYQIDLLAAELERKERLYCEQSAQKRDDTAREGQTQGPVLTKDSLQEERIQADWSQNIQKQIVIEQPENNTALPKNTKRDMEYTAGAIVLCAVGGAFILAAMVMLGRVLMNSLAIGMMFYGVSLLMLLLSECLLYKIWKTLGVVFSAISIGGLYLSTIVNYFFFHNFAEIEAIIILIATSLVTAFISRKRRAVWYRVVGLISCYLCILPVRYGMDETSFLFLVGCLLFLNLIYILLSVREKYLPMNVVHIIANSFFTWLLVNNAYSNGSGIDATVCFVAVFCAMIVMQTIFVVQLRNQYKSVSIGGGRISGAGISTAYGISLVPMAGSILVLNESVKVLSFERLSGMLLLIAIAWIICFVLLRNITEKWYLVYSFSIIAYVLFAANRMTSIAVGGVLGIYLLVKLLGFWGEEKLRVCDAVLTTVVCARLLFELFPLWQRRLDMEELLLAGGVFIGIWMIHSFKTYQEIILTFTLAFFATQIVPAPLEMPLFVGIVFLGMLLYNNTKHWKNKYTIVYNVLALVSISTALVALGILQVYREAYIAYLAMLVFGLAAIVLTLRQPYGMETKHRTIIAFVFLSYMALILQTDYPVINSILLMLVAVLSVAAGFVENRRMVRIYGVILSLLVCMKLALYDFWGAATLQKTLLFFAVGVLALAIAVIYMTLERRKQHTQEGNQQID